MMSTALRTIEFLCLSLWLGSIAFLSFVVAPGAFSVLPGRDVAGTMVSYSLGRLHLLGLVCGGVLLLARLARLRGFGGFAAPAMFLVLAMMLLTGVSQFGVSSRMAQLRRDMGSIEKAGPQDPRRLEFDRLHQRSVALETGVLLAGLGALYFLTREATR
ncbi:MAG TPA: DUF4149 domain-containing protein [Methylomirabilota bacterium]|nr:DUF4149 domain-containing protein [Methylomirabilota bacterium]